MTKPILMTLPLIPLRGLLVYPQATLSFNIGRSISINAAEMALEQEKHCLIVSQKDAAKDEVTPEDLYAVGTVVKIKQMMKLGDDAIRVTVEGISRARILKFVQTEPLFEVEAVLYAKQEFDEMEARAYSYTLLEAFERYQRGNDNYSHELRISLMQEHDLEDLIDKVASNMNISIEDKQELLENASLRDRAETLLRFLNREIELKRLENNIQNKVRQGIEKGQKEYYLREQMRVIRSELGDEDSPENEAAELLEKLKALPLDDESRTKVEKEIKRYGSLPPGSHEAPGLRTWIDWVFDLPWGEYTDDNYDLDNAKAVLERDHYGLDKVKERVLEHLAVCKLKGSTKGSILCFVGPPGVGKTSVASSIAEAMGRKFVRMSLGGVRDESEIRGHRRTYIGAIPGRFVSALKQAGSMNPLMLLDEIDKLGSDHRGDPAAALLEVLDSAQNSTFRDHYLELSLDLSKVMFITTANTLSTVPRPLLDRMEVVELSSYTEQEKIEIGERHLLPKQIKEHALKTSQLKVSRDAMRDVVLGYTREAGVRNLERKLGEICRKTTVQIVGGEKKRVSVTAQNLKKYLGIPQFRREKVKSGGEIGTVNGLAWTSVGGEMLCVEALIMKGSGRLSLTGQLGDVMKESAQAGYTYIKANAANFGIDASKLDKIDIHIHIPEGAIPKDGPSAGITMATAMISALSGIPVRADVAMTGEITLRGKVLPIGGLKEKCIAAEREGIKTVIIPAENKPNLEDLPETVAKALKFVYANELEDVLKKALIHMPKEMPAEMILPIYPPADLGVHA